MIAYLGFVKRNPELHKDSKFKMPGGKYMAYAILVFFAFIFVVLLINSTTRFAVLFAPFGQSYLSSCIKSIEKNLKKRQSLWKMKKI